MQSHLKVINRANNRRQNLDQLYILIEYIQLPFSPKASIQDRCKQRFFCVHGIAHGVMSPFKACNTIYPNASLIAIELYSSWQTKDSESSLASALCRCSGHSLFSVKCSCKLFLHRYLARQLPNFYANHTVEPQTHILTSYMASQLTLLVLAAAPVSTDLFSGSRTNYFPISMAS